MKKIFIIFAAMAAVLLSCSKSEIESASRNGNEDIILNISVSNPDADTDAKAFIKTGWAKDDRIKIWYDNNTGEIPDLVIKYDGYNWDKDISAPVSGKQPSTGENKYIKAVYNNYVIVASKDDYTFNENTLTFNIKHWLFLTEIQVVVKDITYDYNATYKLKCDMFTPTTDTGFSVGADGITAKIGTKGYRAIGIPNADGVAFVFATAEYSTSSEDNKDFTFTLTDDSTGADVTKTLKVNTAIETMSGQSINALKISYKSFK